MGDRTQLPSLITLLMKEKQLFTIDKRVLFSSSGISEVMGRGPTIHDGDLFRAYAREAIDQWHTEHKVTVSYDQLGWKDDFNAFLLGDKLYKNGRYD